MRTGRVSLCWIMLFLAATCADPRPTAPAADARGDLPSQSRASAHEVDVGGPVAAKLVDNAGAVVGDFVGRVRVVGFSLDDGGHLVANGLLNGTATANGVATTITNRPFSSSVVLGRGATDRREDDEVVPTNGSRFRTALLMAQQRTGSCHIASIGLVAIPIDVLGLNLTLSLISLDLNGTTGPDRALGNLLCTLIRLLDTGNVTPAVTNVLSRINALLGGIHA